MTAAQQQQDIIQITFIMWGNKYPLAELCERILDSANGSVIDLVIVLWNSKCAQLSDYSREESDVVFDVVVHGVELVIKLREDWTQA